MMCRLAAFIALASLPLLSGCVAALLPLAAVGVIGKNQIDEVKTKREFVAVGALDLRPTQTASVAIVPYNPTATNLDRYTGQGGLLDGTEILDQLKPDGEYYLPYREFANYAHAQAVRLASGDKVSSVVMVPSISLDKPKTISCTGKPLAVLIDLDGQTDENWLEAETVYRQNGLVEALDQLRAARVSVIWISNHSGKAAGRLASILHEAKLATGDADDFLFLDRGGDDRKQARRWDAARNYCIVAMAGDVDSDFDELYDYLLNPDGAASLDYMYYSGWFIAPPPLVAGPGSRDAPAASSAEAPQLEQDEG